MIKIIAKITFILTIMLSIMTGVANAATYTQNVGTFTSSTTGAGVGPSNIMGYNLTHGFAMPIDYCGWVVYRDDGTYNWDIYIQYTLPDDGSHWVVKGNVIVIKDDYIKKNISYSAEHNTPGAFTGVSIEQAVNAANAAKSSADAAKNSADTAAARSYYSGNTSGYWSYNAYSVANSANSNASAAKTEAINAKNAADTASSRVWDSTEGKSAATLSKEARDKANTAANNTAYIRNTQLPSLENKIANLETTVNNINNNIGVDNLPPTLDWVTVSGAYATSGSSISIIITASDNVSSNLEYSINGGAYFALPADGIVSAPVTSTGPIVVRVRDESGNVASKARTVWKL